MQLTVIIYDHCAGRDLEKEPCGAGDDQTFSTELSMEAYRCREAVSSVSRGPMWSTIADVRLVWTSQKPLRMVVAFM